MLNFLSRRGPVWLPLSLLAAGYCVVLVRNHFLEGYALGVIGCVLLGIGAVLVARMHVQGDTEYLWPIEVLASGAGLLLMNALALYFFRFTVTYALVTLAIWVAFTMSLAVRRFFKHDSNHTPEHKVRPPVSLAKTCFSISVLCLSLVLIGLFLWQLLQTRSGEPLYHGWLPAPVVPYSILLALLFGSLFIAFLRRLPVYVPLIIGTFTLVVVGLLFRVTIDGPYGADSWRHIAVEEYVASGARYEPTSLRELLQLRSEKLPNGLQYTLVASSHYYSGVSLEVIHKYLSMFMYAMIYLTGLYYLWKLFQRSVLVIAITIGALCIPATAYIAQLTTPQSLGLSAFFLCTILWLRYVQIMHTPWYMLLPITLVAILAYPTTGYASAIVAITALALQARSLRQWPMLRFFGAVAVGALAGAAITIADVAFKHIPMQVQYSEHWWAFLKIVLSWATGLLQLTLTHTEGIVIILVVYGLILLYRSNPRSFYVLFVPLIAAQVALWARSAFSNEMLPLFSDRVNMLYWLILLIPFAFGITAVLQRFVQLRLHLGVTLLFILLFFFALPSLDPSRQFFGWSTTAQEKLSVDYIREHETESYVVLTDEVTSAAGSARTSMSSNFSWYPDGAIHSAYLQLLGAPSVRTIKAQCPQLSRKKIYFISTPIPPTDGHAELNTKLKKFMRVEQQQGTNTIFSYTCAT